MALGPPGARRAWARPWWPLGVALGALALASAAIAGEIPHAERR